MKNPLVIYDSLTGNVDRFASRLEYRKMKLSPELEVNQPYFLVTYTTGFGEVPKSTQVFLQSNYSNLLGVASSGNKNWGQLFGRSADIISLQYNVPILCKFELSGTTKDTERFIQEVNKIVQCHFEVDRIK
ncbi:class Ib ribonucleoside-diphosphate reductase assembly flavoprotein NrdI [Brevibacillus laterosporus]|uniref:class Ib ribonucleoside-diphosphate reductase assembly flavoprotein NrdI n=1 Tax=Brevibacillus laterosporus TaxID=1465 RepID=UPI000E6C08F4|nr:class Ib ribonucleoside-diphosphate reductase assembly flavoprotein NrdI [Brevibacillus laterosporus]AYB37659.1 class Ib ribonucleoside-diphosphate reductase assembly flavoprotein NrdI [Brevibacillus laterosporus]MBM7111582.1 putative NrdI-like protein [Brevibacillus laterosporus]